MKLGLNACTLIVFMLIMGLVAAAPINSAVATSCYWDSTAKKNVCVSDISQLGQPTGSQPTANGQSAITNPYTYGCHWDSAAKKNVCGGVIPTAPTATPYTYGYNSYNSYPYNSYYSSSYSYNPYYSHYSSSGYHYYHSIYTSLCGWQYNVYVNFDYNCANDYPA